MARKGASGCLMRRLRKYWGRKISHLCLRFPEGKWCNRLRRILFWVDRAIGQEPENFVRPGETVVFCGMWRTETMERWSKTLGCAGNLIVMEADPRNCDILRYEARRRRLNNVRIINQALWDEDREIILSAKRESDANIVKESPTYSLNRDLDDPTFQDEDMVVRASRMDNILSGNGIEHVDHFHFTIGGSELQALRGMNNTFKKKDFRLYVKSILYEKETRKPVYEDVVRLLKEKGMEIHYTRKDKEQLGRRIYAFFGSEK